MAEPKRHMDVPKERVSESFSHLLPAPNVWVTGSGLVLPKLQPSHHRPMDLVRAIRQP